MKRRTYLAGAVGLLGGTVAVSAPSLRGGAQQSTQRSPSSTLLPGTEYETPIYRFSGDGDGPTGVIVGGMHGDERSGFLATERVGQFSIDAGELVVVPRVNQPAIEANTRHGIGGDLNRQFPPGETPTTKLARALWNDVVRATDPDFLMDLHRSKGIYGVHPDFVGQAIFPTDVSPAKAHATETINRLNDDDVSRWMPYHKFTLGNVMHGTSPLLAHKAGGDLSIPAYIVEAAEFLTDRQTRIDWTVTAATHLLERHGIERTDGGDGE